MRLTQAQRDRLVQLTSKDGRLSPKLVLTDAAKSKSPLHGLFEWNDTRAARLFRVEQAQQVIRKFEIIVTTQTSVVKASGYVHDPKATGSGYRSVVSLRSEPDQARAALVDALRQAHGHLLRAQNLAVALGLAHEYEAMLAEITGMQTQIENVAA